MDTVPETLSLFVPSEKGRNAMFKLTAKYKDEAQVLSALYQLWSMPEMTKRPSCIGSSKTNYEFETGISSSMLDGVDEAAFCTNFYQCGLDEFSFIQSYRKDENTLYIKASLAHNCIIITMFGDEAKSILMEIQESLNFFHPVPKFLRGCTRINDVRAYVRFNWSSEKVVQEIFRLLQQDPNLAGKIMVAERGDTQYRIAGGYEPHIEWIYAFDLNKRFFVAYNTMDDQLTSFNFQFPLR